MSPLNVAHRGASARAPENTLAAFDLALARGADMVELDLQMTRDDVLVAIHDSSLARTGLSVGYRGRVTDVSHLTLDQLKRHDVGSWFNQAHPSRAKPIFEGLTSPTLAEILVRYRDKARLMLELKHPERWPRSPLAVLSMIEDFGLGSHAETRGIFVASSHRRTLSTLARRSPSLPLLEVFGRGALTPALRRRGGISSAATGVAACAPDLDAFSISMIHAAGLEVFAWTVNSRSEMRRLVDAGAEGIITDHPKRLRGILLESGSPPLLTA